MKAYYEYEDLFYQVGHPMTDSVLFYE